MTKFTKVQTRSYGAFKKAQQGVVGAFNKISPLVTHAARHVASEQMVAGGAGESMSTLGTASADARSALSNLSMAGM